MSYGIEKYDSPCAPSPLGAMVQQPTLKQRCEMAVKQAEEQLAIVKEARDIFARNPDFERLLDLMQKGRF